MPRIVPPRVARYSQEALECLAQGHRGRRATETPAHVARPYPYLLPLTSYLLPYSYLNDFSGSILAARRAGK